MEKVNLKDKVCCVVDNGLFVEIAITLSKDFKKVLYFTEWRNSFPSKKGVMIGTGFNEIERINNLFDVIDEVDVFVFPDCYDGDLQCYLRQQGKFVFGGGNGDELELWRAEAKKLFKKLGLPVNPYKVIIGLETLRNHLKKVENKFVKISCYRGECETFHHNKYFLTEPILDLMESKMGAMQYDYEFIVEDAIDGDDVVEAGTDLYTIDGKYPKNIICGFEIKDLGYIGKVNEFEKLSPLITNYNIKISDTLKDYEYRGFMSSEIRVGKDKISYMIDACQRAGSPPNELYQQMIENLGEIVWYGSQGILVEPVYKAKYGIEVLIHSDWASENWQSIYFPEKIREWIKLRNACKIKGTYYIVPQSDGLPEIGAIVAIGDSVDECIKKVTEYAEQVEGYRIDIKLGSIENMKEVIEKASKLGIKPI